jgi:Outer membrane protein beta-barrel domain
MGSRIYLAAFAVSVVMFNSDVASGQSSNASVSASYTLLRDTDLDFTFKRGVSFGGAYRLHEWLFVVAELAFSAHHQDYSAVQGGIYDFQYQSFQAGPRVAPVSGRVQPYIEVLAGGTRLGIWERLLDRTGEWGSLDFSVQPGLGVDMFVGRHLAVRVAGDLRLLFRHDQRFDRDYRSRLYRFNTGLVFHFAGE